MAKTTNFAQPILPLSLVANERFCIISPNNLMASIFIPALEDATFILEQTISVDERAFGIDLINISSALVIPFSTSAEKPPMKFTPTFLAALSNVDANAV